LGAAPTLNMETIIHDYPPPTAADPSVLRDAPATTIPKGGISCKKTPLNETTPPSLGALSTPLADVTVAALRAYFAERRHAPSEAMWSALRAVAHTLEAMADGGCPPLIHLSSLDPGVGKTTTVICFLRALLASSAHADVAALVCVRRKDQIDAIVQEAGLDRADFAVLTADPTLNALGCGTVEQARVLFTTHSMVESRCAGKRFARVADFHYQGRPRAVRIWDEAILPGKPLTISRDDLASLLRPLRGRYPAFASDLETLFTSLKATKDGHVVGLPDLAEDHGVDLNQALETLTGRPEQASAAEVLWLLFGRHVTVRQDGACGDTLLDYQDTLPDDIAPLLTLDASGCVRTVYEFWEQFRGGITRLPSARKEYDNLSIHVWNRGGGKGAFQRNGRELVEGIVATIKTRPEEPWLIVHHKAGIDMDFEAEVRDRLPLFGPTVHFLHWGAHDATNQFAHVPNVILAGTLFLRLSDYEALGRLASAYPSSRGRYDDDEIRRMMLGEHRHMILQALCRGLVRKCVGDGCPPSRAYIIASSRSGIGRSCR
jgi:hypothetical protein